MKKILVIVCLTIVSTGVVFSQAAVTQEEKDKMAARYQAYMEKLNLAEEQKPKVEEINTAYFDGLLNLKNSNGSKMEKFRTFRALSSTRDKEMKNVLTKQQYAIYKQNQQEQRDNFRERRRSQH